MTKAPERIWAVDGLTEILSFNVYDNGGTEYIRADHALALVAAERDDLVKAHRQGYAQGGAAGETLRKAMVDRIEELEAENSRLREALGKALERLEASVFKNAEHAQAAEIIFAVLQDKERTND